MCSIRVRILIVIGLLLAALQAGAAHDLSIYLRYATFDPLISEPPVPANLRAVPAHSEPSFYIVQCDRPVTDSWKASLVAAGAEIHEYLPHFAFLVKMSPEQVQVVRSVEHVRWVGAYHNAYKIDPRLAGRSGIVNARIKTHRGGNVDRLRKEIIRLDGVIRGAAQDEPVAHVDSSIPATNLAKIARMMDVAWIEPEPEYKLLNNIARGLAGVPELWSVEGLYGSGEIVAVCDTGLDMGTMGPLSSDFAGRLFKTYKLGRPNEWNDPNGHGTHVCGTVLGSGVLSGSNPATRSYAGSFAGVAPEANLIIQSVLDSSGRLGGIPADLKQLFRPPYRDGARVHNNSWGSAVNGTYTTDAQAVDEFTWSNRDFVLVFAAGNEGIDADNNGVTDLDSISSPGTAKNCITVGASENYRLSGGYQGGYWVFKDNNQNTKFNAEPLKSDNVSNNAAGMAAFSSRGPTDDGRLKPDVVAPGTNIISARSHLAGAGTLWGVYNADYCYSGGTSMSTPLVSGASALVREYYRTKRNHNPSAALVKATLINGATDLYPGQYGTEAFLEIPRTRPNSVEGWGRINPGYVISPTTPRLAEYVDNTTGIGTAGSATYTYSISGNPSPLRITLVWTDYAGSTMASKALINDLDLLVIAPDNTVLLGNGAVDRTNNVEGIDILNPEPGTYTIRVNGFNVPQGPQPFALVVTGAMGPVPPDAAITSPQWGTYLDGWVTIKGAAHGEGFQQYWLEYGAGSEPTNWSAIGSPVTTPVQDGVLQTWNTSLLPGGEYTVKLTVAGTGGTNTAQIPVQVLRSSIGSLKAMADGTPVTLTGKAVSGIFDGFVYVQELNRTAGIRVNPVSLPFGLGVGSLVTVTGVLRGGDSERVIDEAIIVITRDAE